jgi:protein-S-isoprenylcysteine O-methyltransferase Ste14
MRISRYQKLFGVGPTGLLGSLFLLGLLWLSNKWFIHFKTSAWPRWSRMAGMILIGVWICWHSWAIKTIRMWWSKDHLCTAGPFRLVRHPMYAGAIFLATPGTALILNSWILLLGPILMLLVLSVLIKREEQMMTAVFGEEYEQYAVRTGRFIPRLHR